MNEQISNKEPKSIIWTPEVDAACEKYFIQGIKDDDMFTNIIYPSLVWVAKWQISTCPCISYLGNDYEEISQELIVWILTQFPKYDKTKGTTWFSFCRLWMYYHLKNLVNGKQMEYCDVRKTVYMDALEDVDFEDTQHTPTGNIMEDTEYQLLACKWVKDNINMFFTKSNRNINVKNKSLHAITKVESYINGTGSIPIGKFSYDEKGKRRGGGKVCDRRELGGRYCAALLKDIFGQLTRYYKINHKFPKIIKRSHNKRY